jgi:hypothetical protein
MWHPNVYANGDVCISILHAPGADPMQYEAERKRLITAYAKRNAEGEPVKVESDNDIGDLNALNAAVAALMAETFEVEGIPEGLIEGFPLRGSTWVSPIVVVAEDGKAEKPEKKEESAGE